MVEVINKEKLLMELDRLSKNQTDYNIARGIHADIHMVENAPEVSPCIGCQKEPELIKCPACYYVNCNVYACGKDYYIIYPKMQDAIDKWNNREV